MNVTSSIDVDVDPMTAFTAFTDEIEQELFAVCPVACLDLGEKIAVVHNRVNRILNVIRLHRIFRHQMIQRRIRAPRPAFSATATPRAFCSKPIAADGFPMPG